MKKYEELTQLGKKRRMHKAAREAMKEYDIDVKNLSYLTEESNMFFKAVDYSGNKFAVKVFEDESSKLEDNLAEIFLIEQVRKNSDIIVPEVVISRKGNGIVKVRSGEREKRIAVYKWLEGKEVDGREDYGYFPRLGELAAKLHSATEKTAIPPNISPKKWDKVFYYRDEEPVYKQSKYQIFLNKEYHETMDFIIPFLNEKLKSYYTCSKPQLLHADLNPFNVWEYKNMLRLIDFEEAMYALPIHDLAIALFYYKYDDRFDFEKVKTLVYEGYSGIKPLPEFREYDIELLMLARRVNFLNYILLLSDNPQNFVLKNIKRVKEFIERFI